jgi:hypothetical protein
MQPKTQKEKGWSVMKPFEMPAADWTGLFKRGHKKRAARSNVVLVDRARKGAFALSGM